VEDIRIIWDWWKLKIKMIFCVEGFGRKMYFWVLYEYFLWILKRYWEKIEGIFYKFSKSGYRIGFYWFLFENLIL